MVFDTTMLLPIGGTFVGATVVGSMISGAPFMLVGSTMSGGLGATVGYAAGWYAYPSMPTVAVAGAIAVPFLVSGRLDSTTIALGAGAYLGYMGGNYLAQNWGTK
jgi:hypothetical protein